ncbi:Hsp70 family protein [Herpetosiphon giganteus]|uniref:Hsp70 family protein n=1 Tax=Herpetosiphon giganteus TaxID=2029754 RepID=UPI00195C0392|nr:Hsp70 family protein [Herpetosiphon giganteus]MBM7845941.1 molecular chaperone DnaK [Herpetosiphon giganteus]
MTIIVGIDLGTTKSAIAIWKDGEPRIIPDPEGNPIIPSIVALNTEIQQLEVGYKAESIAAREPTAAIRSIKRFMGRRYDDEIVQEALHKSYVSYEVQAAKRRRGGIAAVIGSYHLTPHQVSAEILKHLKRNAEYKLGHSINQAVVTVPAYFHVSQRQATLDAGQIAHLNIPRVLNEPTAACLAYGYKKSSEDRRVIAVYDLGGGTFDISLLEAFGRRPFRVRAINGDTLLGGDDIDRVIVQWVLDQIDGSQSTALRNDVHALSLLRAAVKRAKTELSTELTTRIQVVGPLSSSIKMDDLDVKLTRQQLEILAEPLIQRTLEPCRKALADAKLQPSDVEEVLLVGGQTRMPLIRSAVEKFFNRVPNTDLPPEEVVALGAAVQGAMLAGEDTGIKLADVVPLTLGVRKKGGFMQPLIARNTPVPVEVSMEFSTVADGQEEVEVEIFQGEKAKVAENEPLGQFVLRGIEPAPAGQPIIEVVFRVDSDGIIHVSGQNSRTGNSKQLTIIGTLGLSENDINAMIREAEDYAI